MYPHADLLALVQNSPNATEGWARLLELCERHWPSQLWGRLAGVKTDADVDAAALWLSAQISSSPDPSHPCALYLGLDTLNMQDGDGTNVEVAGSSKFDPDDKSMAWLDRFEWRGRSHLIRGLMTMEAVYRQNEWAALFGTADYVLFLVYSGLVLSEAASRIRWPANSILVWGFHDGDLFTLGRTDSVGAFRRSVDT